MIKVSVIVPIYKVERFIGRCVESLMQQTLQEVEFIFVNDSTPDSSMDVLQQVLSLYPEKHSIILTHEENKGLPAARNTGLSIAKGEYVFHCDSDDWVESDMLEVLYDKAKTNDADIVWSDWFLSFGQNERYMKQPSYDTPLNALKGILSGEMKYNVWNKLVRRSLYVDNHVTFPAGYGMGEDMTMIRLFAFARKVVYVNKAFYHYIKMNETAFSNTYSDRHLVELEHNTSQTVDFIYNKYGEQLTKEIAFFKLEVKFPFLVNPDSKKLKLWSEWYPEANGFIKLNKNLSFRRKFLQWLASQGYFRMVRLYYLVVHKFIYGIIYK